MHSKASQALSKAFRDERGAQTRLAERTGISQTRLSRLARGETVPNLENSQRLKDDPELPIDPAWWAMPAEPEAIATESEKPTGS